MAYQIPELFRQGNVASSFSTVLQSHKLHPVAKERMVYFEVQVNNGFTVPRPLPFGIFAEVENRGNAKESTLQIWVANGYYSNQVEFPVNCKQVFNLNEFIKEAEVCEQVVLRGTPITTDADTWEADQEILDETHALEKRVQIITTNPITEGVWDDELQASHSVTKTLVKESVAIADANYPSNISVVATTATYTEFEEVRCGWFLKTEEVFDTSEGFTVETVRSHYWPPVMQTIPEIAPVIGVDKDDVEYVAANLVDVRYKESYNGPSRADVTRAWSLAVPSPSPITQLITDAFQYQGIFFNFESPESLHPVVNFFESVGSSHPVLKSGQVRSKTYPGTTETDWPSQVEFMEDVRPYKGGYLYDVVVIYSPGN